MADEDQLHEQFDQAVLNAVAQNIIDDGYAKTPMVTGYVVLAEWIDDDGDGQFFGAALKDQTASRSIGMIVYGEEHERELMRLNIRREWEDDDGA
jgi:hypothetical protein